MTTGEFTEDGQPAGVRWAPDRASQPSAEYGTLLLAVLAMATLTAARSASYPHGMILLAQSGLALSVPLAFLWLRRRHPALAGEERYLALLVPVWCILPWGLEAILRSWGIGEAHELLMLVSLQHGALILGVFPQRRRCQQVSALLGGFLVLFAVVIEARPLVFLLAGLHGVWLLWWLMARYWERLQDARSAIQVTSCLPVRWSVWGGTVLATLLVASVFGASGGATYVLRGMMPASGGERWYDPFARAGVGDGDAMVAAREDAMSFGPVESELFLESQMPTLYDMFNELYGEPLRPQEKQERAVNLMGETIRYPDQRVAETRQSGREFSTLRRRVRRRNRVLDDRDSPAMLYAVGEVPSHLGLETFDMFDGVTWSSTPRGNVLPALTERIEGERCWFYFRQPGRSPIERDSRTHALKVINLKTNRVPAPPYLTAVHIDRLDQADFWGWTDDGMPAMVAREQIPQLTVLHVRSRQWNLQELRETDFTRSWSRASSDGWGGESSSDGFPHAYLQVPLGLRPRLEDWSEAWTRGVPRGWRQVEAVVRRLRQDFRREAEPVGVEAGDVVQHFLKRGSGPEYAFATTAALMLRQLGYPTRLVAGFYARGERYDRMAGQTSVLAEDAHVWVEVGVDAGTWVTIEPSPGYRAPREALGWRQRVAEWGRAGLRAAAGHPWQILGALCLLIAGWRSRLRWMDAVARGGWWLAGRFGTERRLRATIRLLEWRCRRSGQARPPHVTLSQWYAALAGSLPPETSHAVQCFLRQSERLLYCPRQPPRTPGEASAVALACCEVVRGLNLSCLRESLPLPDGVGTGSDRPTRMPPNTQ